MADQDNNRCEKQFEHDFLHQNVNVKKHFSNRELLLYDLFYETTNIYPKNIIVLQNFLFFFIDGEHYFKAKQYLINLNVTILRNSIENNIILIIREENTLIKLLYNLFPDSYVHDISLRMNKKTVVSIHFLSLFQNKGSIGFWNQYFKILNKLFEDFVEFEGYSRDSLIINYKLVDLSIENI